MMQLQVRGHDSAPQPARVLALCCLAVCCFAQVACSPDNPQGGASSAGDTSAAFDTGGTDIAAAADTLAATDANDAGNDVQGNDVQGDDVQGDDVQGDDSGRATTPCTTSADCPQPASACARAMCDDSACSVVPRDEGAACATGDKCVLTARCKDTKCMAVKVRDCDDHNPCTADGCAADGQCKNTPASAGTTCDDGSECTKADTCNSTGQCVGADSVCACQTYEDCALLDDGNACNGSLYCRQSDHKCVINPATIVDCDTSADGPCRKTACSPELGACVTLSSKSKLACEDGNPCTIDEACDGFGNCVAGKNVCACVGTEDCAALEDGNPCNGTLYCDKTAPPYSCKIAPSSLVYCNPALNKACLYHACDPTTGVCAFAKAPADSPCDDGDACTAGDHCDDGSCGSGTDVCVCQEDADCAAQEDGDLCNGTLFCDKVSHTCKLNPKTVVKCPSGADTDCTKTACLKAAGKCVQAPLNGGEPCDDGNACTTGGSCKAGVCVAGANACECAKDGDCAAKEDGNLCNGTLFCDNVTSKCVVNKATVLSCPNAEDTACLHNTCVPASGECTMTTANENKACNADDSDCTKGDRCTKGVCTPGTNICACNKDGDCESQEDGDACNGALFCNKVTGGCELNPATVVVCKSVNDTKCSKNACVPQTGKCAMTIVNQGLTCDDGNPCTKSESCLAGKCQSGTNVCACEQDADCAKQDDNDPCTAPLWCDKTGILPRCAPNPGKDVACPTNKDTKCLRNQCDSETGKCALTPINHKQVCAPGTLCAAVQICVAGTCVAGKALSCDDGNPCSADTCDDFTGCVHKVQSKTDCDDGNKCTSNDVCVQGFCTGTIADCNDNSPCTQDVCAPLVGCVYIDRPGPCSDGDACTGGDSCKDGKCVATKKITCDDGNQCTINTCDKAVGCTTKPMTGSCDDGDVCTVGDSCKSGACLPTGPNKCDDGNACTDDECKANVGCKHWALKDGASCDDGDKCTAGDVCEKVVCKTTKTVCDDDNVCTSDSCDGKTGRCVFAAIKDGTKCHGAGMCAKGNCVDAARGRVRVPAGLFYMGCNDATDKLCALAESPQHKVELDAYWIGLTEVTQATYRACVIAGACEAPVNRVVGGVYGVAKSDQRPINGITREEAHQVCTWRGGRLPTEAEWEKAARGGCEKRPDQDCAKTTPTWPHGNKAPTCPAVSMDQGGKAGCGTYKAANAGAQSSNASPYGALDMAGNVMEWVFDVYDKDYYTSSPIKNPKGPKYTVNSAFLRRGGGFASVANDVRSSARKGTKATETDVYTGVRCAWDSWPCDDGNPCTKDALSGGKCAHAPVSGSCDDGDGCTISDTCESGACKAGKARSCDDHNPCTTDSCDKSEGRCKFTPVQDGKKCTDHKGGACSVGHCVWKSRDEVLIPAGTFWMGCNPYLQTSCGTRETPQMEVELSPYWIDRHEVTAARYKACVDAGTCASSQFGCSTGHNAPSAFSSRTLGVPGLQNHPVNCVSWYDADTFCKWDGGRLPTEAEWARAARGGCETRPNEDCKPSMPPHPWGTAKLSCYWAVVATTDGEKYAGCGEKFTWPVGSKTAGASPYGVMDMTGNVEEWVADWGRWTYSSVKKKDPIGWTVSSLKTHKVIRGAHYGRSWYITNRGRDKPNGRWNVTGFRCARSFSTCDDGNDCTVDSGTAGQCTHKARTGSCDDGDLCTGAGVCQGTTCSKGKATHCDDANACTTDSCDAQTGFCQHKAVPGCQS